MSLEEKLPVTAFVLAYNEERNLEDCLRSLHGNVDQIVVVDSFSSDKTLEIAREYTCDIYQHEFINQAKQFIWGMENCKINNDWVIRVDADERWTEEGFARVRELIEFDEYDGISVRMKIYFMGRWLKRGGMYPNFFLRVFKRSKGAMEDRWMDEHINVHGAVIETEIDVLEQNYDRQENISLWIDKHNKYSTREALENLIARHGLGPLDSIADVRGGKTAWKRWMKENAYAKAPLFVRPYLYFAYRYIFQLGLLEGREGLVFHTLHAFWYRFLVDLKVFQIEQNARRQRVSIAEAIKDSWGIEI